MMLVPHECAKEHVYVFIVHGTDPLDYANLGGLKQFCHELGFPNVYLGQIYHGEAIREEIQQLAPGTRLLPACDRGHKLLKSQAQCIKQRSFAMSVLSDNHREIRMKVEIAGSKAAKVLEPQTIDSEPVIWLAHGVCAFCKRALSS